MNHKVTKFAQKYRFWEDKISRPFCSMLTFLGFQLTGTVTAYTEMWLFFPVKKGFYLQWEHTHMHARTHIFIHIHTFMHTHIYAHNIHSCTHTFMNTHIYAHTIHTDTHTHTMTLCQAEAGYWEAESQPPTEGWSFWKVFEGSSYPGLRLVSLKKERVANWSATAVNTCPDLALDLLNQFISNSKGLLARACSSMKFYYTHRSMWLW